MSSSIGRTTPSEGRFPATAPGHERAARTVPSVGAAPMQPRRDGEGSLAHVVETLLDKGLVLNADIMVSVAGVELLGIRLRAALASFETAARYGLEFPSGTDTETAAWRETREERETCPACGKRVLVGQLLNQWCPWCGWRSAQSRLQDDSGQAALTAHRAADDQANGEADGAHDQGAADREAERRGD
ncbi:gas vesicle protein [Streptomyces sp. NPDC053750]|uniref:gas vesicle protein n=1 Tax=Streptomyces sp. NPDC053750 TaxID=3365714 RepID=UPI0037D786A6